jgi:AP-2 complex subunit alpha
MYYQLPAPWLSVKLLRLLQLFPETVNAEYKAMMDDILMLILTRAEPPEAGEPKKKQQFRNANNGVFFEAVALIAHYDSNEALQMKATLILGTIFKNQKSDANLQFLALDGLSQMAVTQFGRPGVTDHLDDIIFTLNGSSEAKQTDTSIQRRAVDVLYGVCGTETVQLIVKELLKFLKTSDYNIREEVVLKCAILAEKFAADYKWCAYFSKVLFHRSSFKRLRCECTEIRRHHWEP